MCPGDDDWQDVYNEETKNDGLFETEGWYDTENENDDYDSPISDFEAERLAWEKHIEQRLMEGYTYEQVEYDIRKFKGEIPKRSVLSQADSATDRQKEIVSWLANSKYAIRLKSGNGFYVLKGSIVRRKNGDKVEILNWLSSEGVIQGKLIAGYDITYTQPGSEYAEKLSFFENTKKNFRHELGLSNKPQELTG